MGGHHDKRLQHTMQSPITRQRANLSPSPDCISSVTHAMMDGLLTGSGASEAEMVVVEGENGYHGENKPAISSKIYLGRAR